MWACCLDAVCKLLQSFGSNRLHGGDESRQLVLGACCCSLQTKDNTVRSKKIKYYLYAAAFCINNETVWFRPAEWCQTPTCSSSGVWGWGRWWGRPSSRDAWWLCEPQTRCCLPPASGCPAPPVDRRGDRTEAELNVRETRIFSGFFLSSLTVNWICLGCEQNKMFEDVILSFEEDSVHHVIINLCLTWMRESKVFFWWCSGMISVSRAYSLWASLTKALIQWM